MTGGRFDWFFWWLWYLVGAWWWFLVGVGWWFGSLFGHLQGGGVLNIFELGTIYNNNPPYFVVDHQLFMVKLGCFIKY